MIVLSILITIISYLIQGTISNYVGYTYNSLSWVTTLYVLIALLILKPYYENEKKYFALLIITGFLVGISYTNAVFLNIILFIISYYITKFFHFYLPFNYLTINISTLLGIFSYHILSFLFLISTGYDHFNLLMLLKILLHSIPMTIIYTTTLYFLVKTLFEKLNLREIK